MRRRATEPTSPPVITDNVIVVAGAVTDNYSTREPSGVIRGFDVNSGKLLWAFDPGAKDPNAIRRTSITSCRTRRTPGHRPPMTPSWISSICRWASPRRTSGAATAPGNGRYASGLLALNASTGKLASVLSNGPP